MSASVLIVDNDPGVRGLLAEVIRRHGFEITLANDGADAREILLQRRFDVMVCDLDMPRVSGGELLAWVDGQDGAPRCIVVSGFLDGHTSSRLSALGCVVALLRKPFDILAFGSMVRDLVTAAGEAPE